MPRRPTPQGSSARTVAQFAADLSALREAAGPGALTIDQISAQEEVPRSTLYTALGGDRVPGPKVVSALVRAWGGDEAEWLDRLAELRDKAAKRPARARRLIEVSVKLKLPFVGVVSGTWVPGGVERTAAWELYVELVTRAAVVQPLRGGSAQASVANLHEIFGATRDIFHRYGPETSPRDSSGDITFGTLAITVLNLVLRPFIAYWQPRLEAWERYRAVDVSSYDHENSWERIGEFREELERVRRSLVQVAELLAEVAGAAPLIASPSLLEELGKADKS